MAFKRQTKEEKERLQRRRRRQLIGGVLSVLICIGLLTVVTTIAGGVVKLFDNTEEKESYRQLLAPLVMLDPVPFVGLETAEQDLLMEAAVWSTIYNEDLTRYERDDLGALQLPAVDIDKNAAKIYGPDYKLEHGTFNFSGMEFVYDEETQSYTIPVTGTTSAYMPQVEKVKSSVKEKRVTVGYLPPNTGFSLDGANTNADEPVKYYDYVFTRQGEGYYLSAIVDSEMKAPGQQPAADSAPAATADDAIQQAAQDAADAASQAG